MTSESRLGTHADDFVLDKHLTDKSLGAEADYRNQTDRTRLTEDVEIPASEETMSHRMTRRGFTVAGAAAAGLQLPVIENRPAAWAAEPSAGPHGGMAVRPYQLMCVICRIGGGCTDDLGDPRLTSLLKAVRLDPKRPMSLRCNVDSVYRYQNPGHAEDSAEGELFNAKRDLDILQKLGLVPGDSRPAIDLFERVLDRIPQTRGVCGYGAPASDTWSGCVKADSGDYEKGRALGIDVVIAPRDPREKSQYKQESAKAIYEASTLQIRPHHLLCMSCFHGGREQLAPIQEDNLFEVIDRIQHQPDIPVTLIAGVCMICPPCGKYDPANKLCVGGCSMALRDQKKDLDVLQKLGLKYGDTLPARQLFQQLYERIASPREVCGYGDGEKRAPEWSICSSAEKDDAYQKARATRLGIKG